MRGLQKIFPYAWVAVANRNFFFFYLILCSFLLVRTEVFFEVELLGLVSVFSERPILVIKVCCPKEFLKYFVFLIILIS